MPRITKVIPRVPCCPSSEPTTITEVEGRQGSFTPRPIHFSLCPAKTAVLGPTGRAPAGTQSWEKWQGCWVCLHEGQALLRKNQPANKLPTGDHRGQKEGPEAPWAAGEAGVNLKVQKEDLRKSAESLEWTLPWALVMETY